MGESLRNYAVNALVGMSLGVLFVVAALLGIPVTWLMSDAKEWLEIPSATSSPNAPNAIRSNTDMGSR